VTSRDFVYWLQGFLEISKPDALTELNIEQVRCIKNHLNLVFSHEIDNQYGDRLSEAQKIHDGDVIQHDGHIVLTPVVDSTQVRFNC
jgi:hypothetical protein